ESFRLRLQQELALRLAVACDRTFLVIVGAVVVGDVLIRGAVHVLLFLFFLGLLRGRESGNLPVFLGVGLQMIEELADKRPDVGPLTPPAPLSHEGRGGRKRRGFGLSSFLPPLSPLWERGLGGEGRRRNGQHPAQRQCVEGKL